MTESKPLGFSIRIFLPDGRPDGLKIVEKSSWTAGRIAGGRGVAGSLRKRPRAWSYLRTDP
jgi:hypothetical protein